MNGTEEDPECFDVEAGLQPPPGAGLKAGPYNANTSDQIGVNALAATAYPTSLRSSGVGWALGVGRVGAIMGPVIGGELMRLDWSTRQIFLVAAMPAVISTAAMFSMRLAIRPRPARGADNQT